MKTVTLNALDAYLAIIKSEINVNKIDEILNLPAKYRYHAAKSLLTTNEFEVIIKAGVRRNEPKKFSSFLAKLAENAVRQMSYSSADFGRYRYTHKGQNTLPSENNFLRYESGERYSKKYTSTDVYADYFFSIADNNNLDYLIKTSADKAARKISIFDLESYISHYENGVKFDFIYNNNLFKKVGFLFDKKEISVKWKGYEYHIEDYQVFQHPEKTKKLIIDIIKAFQSRKRIAKKEAEFLALPLNKIFVQKEDSLDSGNCPFGTNRFIESCKIDGEFALRADVLLKIRNDNYTKRAILQAYKNGHFIHN